MIIHRLRLWAILAVVPAVLGIVISAAPLPYAGAGTADEPYLLASADDFASLADLVNAGNEEAAAASYRLTRDIDFAGVAYTPIGDSPAHPFRGTLDGDGFAVRNLAITSDSPYAGLFGVGFNVAVTDLILENASLAVTCDGTVTAGLLFGSYEGNAAGEGLRMTRVQADGTLTVDSGLNVRVGGLIGYYKVTGNTASVSDCCVEADITSVAATTSYVGGLIGTVESGLRLTNCVVTGRAYGETTGDALPYTGGVAARFYLDDWIGSASLLEAKTCETVASSIVCAVEPIAVGRYGTYTGNIFARLQDATATTCWCDARFAVPSTRYNVNGTPLAQSALFDLAFLQESVGLDFENTWTMLFDRPVLRRKRPSIACRIGESALETLPVSCGACRLIAAYRDASGRFILAGTAVSDGETPVSFPLPEEGTLTLFALDEALRPLCAPKTVAASGK